MFTYELASGVVPRYPPADIFVGVGSHGRDVVGLVVDDLRRRVGRVELHQTLAVLVVWII